ncbi:MAG: type II secretion system F family protein [Oscillospiraceae bacterium]|nr:type II secretion system F family protein [Oscillospiraceae bacterium]
MLSLLDIIVFTVGAAILALWLFLFVIGLGNRDRAIFDQLDENEYPFKELYFLGYAAMCLIRYEYKSQHDRKVRKEIAILYGERYADYYIRVIYAQKVSLSLTLLTLAAPMYGFANDIAASLVVVMFAAVAYYYFGTLTTEKIIKRSELLLSDFSEAVSKLALLTNAGMNLREAWREVSKAGDTELYQEMRITVNQMDNGMREPDAFYEFGIRCVIPEIKKLTSTIAQALVRGPKEVADTLQAQSKEVWATKKQTVRRKGETAASKLLIPMMLMLIGILVMVVIPIFANIGV